MTDTPPVTPERLQALEAVAKTAGAYAEDPTSGIAKKCLQSTLAELRALDSPPACLPPPEHRGKRWICMATPEVAARIIPCVNAMSGIDDPQALRQAAEALLKWTDGYANGQWHPNEHLDGLRDNLRAALGKKGRE